MIFVVGCGGRNNPIALQPIEKSKKNPVVDLLEKLGDGKPAGVITLYAAVIAQGVPTKVAQRAFSAYDAHVGEVRNKNYISMIDFTQHSANRRFYMINRDTGKVDQWTVAHGAGSDPDNDGYPQYFSNVPDSHMSSLGSYLIQEKYVSSKFGDSLRLDGIDATNSNVRDRAIVLHPSHYVNDGASLQGRSWGCPAIPYDWIQTVIARAQEGSFMYAYGVNRRSAFDDLRVLQQWNMIPKSAWPSESEDAPEFGE